MADPARRRATYEDVLRAPRHQIAQIIEGDLHLQARPAGPHSAVASALGEELGPPFFSLRPDLGVRGALVVH